MKKKSNQIFYSKRILKAFIIFSSSILNAEQATWSCDETLCKNPNGETVLVDSITDLTFFGDNFIIEYTEKETADNFSSIHTVTGKNGKYFIAGISDEDKTEAFISKNLEAIGDTKIKYKNGDLYIGQTLPGNFFIRNGLGTHTFYDGKVYKGEFKDDQITGNGTLITDEWTYFGDFVDGIRKGKGKLVLENFEVKGEFDDGVIYGEALWSNGDRYVGNYSDGKFSGFGTYTWSNGETYSGTYKDGDFHGIGTYKYLNGDSFEGNFKNGVKEGFGSYYYLNSPTLSKFYGFHKNNQAIRGTYLLKNNQPFYIGEIKNELADGNGIFFIYDENGKLEATREGMFRNDKCNGTCEIQFVNGEYFKGSFKDGAPNGFGEYYRGDSKFIGFFDETWQLQGQGKWEYPTFTWEGNFIDSEPDGSGIWTDKKEGIQYSVTFKDGEYIGEGELTLENLANNKRLALVIGNDSYISNPLQFAVNDSVGIANVLENSGFEVMLLNNLSQESFFTALYEFERKIKLYGPRTDVLFYYAGHASQVRGINYLNPVDTVVTRESHLETKSININRVFEIINQSYDGVKIVILDACRNNPFASSIRSVKPGLAQMSAPSGTIIAYSTAPGETAIDGSKGEYGIYTGSLIEAINVPGAPVENVFKETRKLVVQETQGQQIPWESSSLISDFYFIKEN